MSKLLILRPQPGGDETAARAAQRGMDYVIAPLFEIRPMPWAAPGPADFDAVIATSANALRFDRFDQFHRLPLYAVGESTARAASHAGFANVRIGPSDGEALLAMMAADGVKRAFLPVGREHIALEHPDVFIERRVVYAAEAIGQLPEAATLALRAGALALLHSPRAAGTFGSLTDAANLARRDIAIAAISPAAAEAAGAGWKSIGIASVPRDEALLELAAELCQR